MDGNAGDPLSDPKKQRGALRSLLGRTNRDWWPNHLSTEILHQQGKSGDPMGDGFSYAEAFKKLDYAAVKRDLLAEGLRVRLVVKTKNTRAIFDQLDRDGFRRYAFLNPGEPLEWKTLD